MGQTFIESLRGVRLHECFDPAGRVECACPCAPSADSYIEGDGIVLRVDLLTEVEEFVSRDGELPFSCRKKRRWCRAVTLRVKPPLPPLLRVESRPLSSNFFRCRCVLIWTQGLENCINRVAIAWYITSFRSRTSPRIPCLRRVSSFSYVRRVVSIT